MLLIFLDFCVVFLVVSVLINFLDFYVVFYGGVCVDQLFRFLCCVLWWGQCCSSF